MRPDLPRPWKEFFVELDAALDEAVQIHCMGGFVLTVCYGMPRATADVDFCEIVPPEKSNLLLELAGEERPLARKYGVYLDPSPITQLPENYLSRLQNVFPGRFERIQLFALELYDLALSKLERNGEQDRDDVHWLARHIPLDPEILRTRYESELRLYLGNQLWHDQTIKLWLEEFFPKG